MQQYLPHFQASPTHTPKKYHDGQQQPVQGAAPPNSYCSKLMRQIRVTHSIEFLVAEVGPTIFQWLVHKPNKSAIYNSNAPRKPKLSHLFLEKALTHWAWPKKVLCLDVAKGRTNTPSV